MPVFTCREKLQKSNDADEALSYQTTFESLISVGIVLCVKRVLGLLSWITQYFTAKRALNQSRAVPFAAVKLKAKYSQR